MGLTLGGIKQVVTENIDDTEKLMEIVTDPVLVQKVNECLPGFTQPQLIYTQRDLIGLYEAGQYLYSQLRVAIDDDDVLKLMHPSNVLPLLTYRRLFQYTKFLTVNITAYGPVAGGSVAYGTADGGNTVYGFSSLGTGDDEGITVEEYLFNQAADNNEIDREC